MSDRRTAPKPRPKDALRGLHKLSQFVHQRHVEDQPSRVSARHDGTSQSAAELFLTNRSNLLRLACIVVYAQRVEFTSLFRLHILLEFLAKQPTPPYAIPDHGLRLRRILFAHQTTSDQDCLLCILDQHTSRPFELHPGTTRWIPHSAEPSQAIASKLDTLSFVPDCVSGSLDAASRVLGDVVESLRKGCVRK
jgi:hypothetical protein